MMKRSNLPFVYEKRINSSINQNEWFGNRMHHKGEVIITSHFVWDELRKEVESSLPVIRPEILDMRLLLATTTQGVEQHDIERVIQSHSENKCSGENRLHKHAKTKANTVGRPTTQEASFDLGCKLDFADKRA
jgi:hypothetical protein